MGDASGDPADSDGTIRTTYDWGAVAPSAGVVETIAVATDRDPTALDPLYEYVKPEALDTLISPRSGTKGDGTVVVTFPYDEFDVTVYSTGEVEVRPANTRL